MRFKQTTSHSTEQEKANFPFNTLLSIDYQFYTQGFSVDNNPQIIIKITYH